MLEIKKCDINDLNGLDKFYNAVLDHLVKTVNYPRWMPGEYPCRESVKNAIEKGEQYAAFSNGEIVGAFVLNSDPAGDFSVGEWQKNLKNEEFAVIHTLATAPNYYGKGIATQIVQFCLQTAKQNCFKAVRLDVVPDNYPAIALYKKCGFVFAGEKDLKRGYEHIPTFCLFEFNF